MRLGAASGPPTSALLESFARANAYFLSSAVSARVHVALLLQKGICHALRDPKNLTEAKTRPCPVYSKKLFRHLEKKSENLISFAFAPAGPENNAAGKL